MRLFIKYTLSFVLLTSWVSVLAQHIDTPMPKVYTLGEYEKEYEILVLGCQEILLSVCNNSMDEAFDKWLTMIENIEDFAKQEEFDLKGIKIWINVFWNNDGTIQNIAYYPKPTSRNIDFSKLTSFFNRFIDAYQMDLTYNSCFSHYGSASFPIFSKLFNK